MIILKYTLQMWKKDKRRKHNSAAKKSWRKKYSKLDKIFTKDWNVIKFYKYILKATVHNSMCFNIQIRFPHPHSLYTPSIIFEVTKKFLLQNLTLPQVLQYFVLPAVSWKNVFRSSSYSLF